MASRLETLFFYFNFSGSSLFYLQINRYALKAVKVDSVRLIAFVIIDPKLCI